MKLKVIVNLVLLLFVTFFISSGEAKETEKKIYVSRDQIVITKDGILAYVDGAKTPIPGKTLSMTTECILKSGKALAGSMIYGAIDAAAVVCCYVL